MSRLERKNMIKYIERMKGISHHEMLYMTDTDIEYIYETIYFKEQIAE